MSKDETSSWTDDASIFDQTETTAHWTEIVTELKSKRENGMIKANGPNKGNGIQQSILVSMATIDKSDTDLEEKNEEESEPESEMMDLEDQRNKDIFSVHDEEEDEEEEEEEEEEEDHEHEEIDREPKEAHYLEDPTTIQVAFDAYESKQEDGVYVIYEGGQRPSIDEEQFAENNAKKHRRSYTIDIDHENDDNDEQQQGEIHVDGFRKDPPEDDEWSNKVNRLSEEHSLQVDETKATRKKSVALATSNGTAKVGRASANFLEPTRMSEETRKFIVQIMDGDEREQLFRSCFDGSVKPGSLVEIIDQRTGRPVALAREDFVSIVEAIPVEKKLATICNKDVESALNNALQFAVGDEDRSTFMQPEIKYDFLIDPRMKNTLDGAFADALENVGAMTAETSEDIESYMLVTDGPLQTPEALRKERFSTVGRTPPVHKPNENVRRDPPSPPAWFDSSRLSPSIQNGHHPNGDVHLESGNSTARGKLSARSMSEGNALRRSNSQSMVPEKPANDIASSMKPSYRRDRATKARYTRRENCCKRHLCTWIFLIVLLLIVLCCVGGAAYYYFMIYRK